MDKALVLAVLVLFTVSFASASSGFYDVNGSEPKFLKGIGPQDERADEPLVAVAVALAVAAFIIRGLQRHSGD